jgi:dephospho-CoA kinase
MHVIGVLGGVAGGKSLVTEQLTALGAVALDADEIGHEVLRLPEIEAAAKERWGEKVFGPDGRIDRGRLARVVFADPPEGPPERAYLEQLTHPEISRIAQRRIDAMSAAGVKTLVLDASLLLEAGWDRRCDTLVFVDAPGPVRRRRAAARGWKEGEFQSRESAQRSPDVKRRRADVIIDNSGSIEHTRAQVERFWQSLPHGDSSTGREPR